MAEQEQDRSQPATPFKLREARRRGQVAKSIELNSASLLAVVLIGSYLAGESVAARLASLFGSMLSQAGRIEVSVVEMLGMLDSTVMAVLNIFGMFVASVVLAGILSNLLQTGPVFSFFPLTPDFKKLNPVTGFKRLFSIRTVFEAGKTLFKIGAYGAILFWFFSAVMPGLMGLLQLNADLYPKHLMDLGRELMLDLLFVILFVAALDLIFVRWHFLSQMRMSHREVREEIKRREGDPHIKSKLRQLQREAVKKRASVGRVKNADVVITNPTRIAVAVVYRRGEMRAPKVIAKGSGETARKMRELATRHGVPVIENRRLARDLFRRVLIDGDVPEALFPLVARILVWAYALRDRRHMMQRAGAHVGAY